MADSVEQKTRKSGKTPQRRKSKRGAVKREEALALDAEVERARILVREVGEAVLARLEGRAAALHQALTGEGLPEAPALPRAERLKRLRQVAAGLKVKPGKGRVKDLARLEALFDALEEALRP